MKGVRRLAVSVGVLVWCGITRGAILHVPADYPTIQGAIDAAVSGQDKIEVAPGTYYETINFNGKAIELFSSTGPANTIIDGTGYYHVVQCVAGEGPTTILRGFTITGGSATGEHPDDAGGGMCNRNNSPTVTNCAFIANSATAEGGGMSNDTASPTVTDCTFSNNWSGSGGAGMHNNSADPTVTDCVFAGNSGLGPGGAMYNRNSSPVVTACTFSDNFAQAASGGGMFNYAASPTVDHCTFSANRASDGGGISNNNSNPTVTHCVFADNYTGEYGAGMCNDYNSSPAVADCTFTGNFTQWWGGGMYSGGGSPTVTNCAFLSNNAMEQGGGMYSRYGNPTITNCIFRANSGAPWAVGGGMYNFWSSLTVSNCVFSGNPGGGIAQKGGSLTVTNSTFVGNIGNGLHNFFMPSSLALHNCIVWSNSGGQIVCEEPSTAAVTYSDVQGGWPGAGNIDADPLFVNAGGGDLHLLPNAPCIDAGTNSPPGGLPGTDIEGNPRPTDGNADGAAVADMGAYERQAIAGEPTPVGEDVLVEPPDSTTGTTPISLTFETVTAAGYTSLSTSASGPPAPADFRFGDPATYFDVTTTASYAGPISVSIDYSATSFQGAPERLRLYHWENNAWVDCTTTVDAANQVIRGVVTSLSPFVVLEPALLRVAIDIKPGSFPNSINKNGSGLIPVAILGSAALDVRDIDPLSLSLAGLAVRVKSNGTPQSAVEDVNQDGYDDLVCQFVDDVTMWQEGTTTGVLTGTLKAELGGMAIEGSDEIRVVP